jgi:hypothetical protein
LLPSFDDCDVAHPPPCLSIVPSMEEGRSTSATIVILELHAVFFRPPSLPPCLACYWARKMMSHLKILEVLPPCKEIIITLLPLFIIQCTPFATSLDLNCFSSHLLLLPCCPLSLVYLPRVFLLLPELSMY